MATRTRQIEIESVDDWRKLIEEVAAGETDYTLVRDGVAVAELRPPQRPAGIPRRELTATAMEAFLSTAGSWKDVDADRLLRDIYADRDRSFGPHYEL
ncbi:MAG: hypothetical protein ACYDCQ_22965 [Dehalococcoidia bacterium]